VAEGEEHIERQRESSPSASTTNMILL